MIIKYHSIGFFFFNLYSIIQSYEKLYSKFDKMLKLLLISHLRRNDFFQQKNLLQTKFRSNQN